MLEVRMRPLALAAAILVALAVATPVTPAVASSESCLPSSLKSRLSDIRKRYGVIKIVSTHRKGAKIKGSGRASYHASCRAVDFVPPRGKYSEVTRWLYANHEGGVGTYSCMNHIHIDNGPNVRWSRCR